jgi:hypothetical protein
MKHPICIAVIFTMLPLLASLHAKMPVAFAVDTIAPPPSKGPWPTYTTLRFNEDYSWLGQTESARTLYRDGFDPLKNLTSSGGDWHLAMGGSARLRYEGYKNFNFGPGNDDSAYLLSRFLVHGDLRVNDRLRLFAELRSANVYGRDLPGGKSNALADEFDVMNLFIDWIPFMEADRSLMMRGGRWEQMYGRGRMIASRDWSQLRTPVQGIKVRYLTPNYWLDLFAADLLTSTKYDWMERNKNETILGVYSHFRRSTPGLRYVELYALEKNRRIAGRDVDRLSLGSRIGGALGKKGWSWEVEGAYQLDTGDVEVSAHWISLQLEKAWTEARWSPTFKFTFEYASGDSKPSDGKITTFEPVLAAGHAFFGDIDVVARQNIVSPALQLILKPDSKTTLRGDLHFFWLADSADALYSTANSSQVLRRGYAGASQHVGTEVNVSMSYRFNHHANLLLGYGHLFAGDFIADTGADVDIDRIYLQLSWLF